MRALRVIEEGARAWGAGVVSQPLLPDPADASDIAMMRPYALECNGSSPCLPDLTTIHLPTERGRPASPRGSLAGSVPGQPRSSIQIEPATTPSIRMSCAIAARPKASPREDGSRI